MKIPVSTKNKDNNIFKVTNSFNNIISINSKSNINNKMTPTNQKISNLKSELKNVLNSNDNKENINTSNYMKTTNTNESHSKTKDQIKVSSINIKSCSNSSINQNHYKLTNNSLTNESRINMEKLNRGLKENPFIQSVEKNSSENDNQNTNIFNQLSNNNKLVTKIKTFQSSSTARDNKLEDDIILKTINNFDKDKQSNIISKNKTNNMFLSVKENKYKDSSLIQKNNENNSNLSNQSNLSLTPNHNQMNKYENKGLTYSINQSLIDIKKPNLAFVNYSNKNDQINKGNNKIETNLIKTVKHSSNSLNKELSNKDLKTTNNFKYESNNTDKNNFEKTDSKKTFLLPPKTTRNFDISEKLTTESSILDGKKLKISTIKGDEKEVMSQNKIESFKDLKYINYKKDNEEKFKLMVDKVKFSNQGYGVINAYSATTNQGKVRNYNEDRVSIILNINKPTNKEETLFWPKCSFFGIYDGHAGATCADFLRDNLHKFIINDKNFPENPQVAILNGFILAEKLFLEFSQNNRCSAGSCAIVILIVDKRCYVANLGDSRAIMSGSYGEKVYILSRDHKPNDEKEYKRIIEAGGQIYQTEANIVSKNGNENILGPLRVKPGKLSVTRTIGDMEAKLSKFGGNSNVVIGIPDIKYFEIHEHYDFILLGCKIILN